MKKVNIRLGISSLLLVSLFLTSCKDWDEHYDAGSAVEGSATATIWENITANPNLSQFATLVQKAGYEDFLKATQTLTVWAPLNDTFDYEALMNESNETVLKEFVQNHIARNNYPASGQIGWSISMLNLKHLVFEGNGNYTMDGVAVAQPNVASVNGVLHTISGKLQFRSNILESLIGGELPIDSVSNYVHGYDEIVFNEKKSTKGPVIDGQITYLDSVFDEYNLICQRYAYINREDSNYSMIVPSNEAWTKAMNCIKQCYNYVSFTYCDNPDSIKNEKYEKKQVNFAPSSEYWKDSISYGKMLDGLFYNNNLYDNKKLKNLASGEIPQVDSLMTTNRTFIYGEDARNLFAGTTRVEKSNGAIFVTDGTLNMQPWLFWNPLINIEAEYSSNLASVAKVRSTENAWVLSGEQNENVPGTVSNRGYLIAYPSSSDAKVELNFRLRNLRSTTYVVYGVFVPPHITNPYILEKDIKSNIVQVNVVSTNEASGKLVTKETTLSRTVEVVNEDGTTTTKKVSQFTNDPHKVDTICFGEITFPICYYGMAGSPYLRIISLVKMNDGHDRTVRIDRIFLVPKELDDYLKEHPDYKVHY